MHRLHKILRRAQLLSAQGPSDTEIASLAHEILHNYRKTGLLLNSIAHSLNTREEFGHLSKFVASAKLGHIRDFGSLLAKPTDAYAVLLGILSLGLKTGGNIEKSLESFHLNLIRKIDLQNKINSRVKGMQTITLLGLVFFFPLFSGIAASIASYSIASTTSRLYISGGIRALCLSYISIILVITNCFTRPWRSFWGALLGALPFALFASLLQYASYYFALYAI